MPEGRRPDILKSSRMRPPTTRSLAVLLAAALCPALAAGAAPAAAETAKASPIRMRPVEALSLAIPDATEASSISRQEVLDELHSHFAAIAPHLEDPDAVAAELTSRIIEPGTPYARVLAGQSLAGALIKQRAFLQVRHHLLTQYAESDAAGGIRRYQTDKAKRARLIQALAPLRQAVAQISARGRNETRDVLDRLFLDDSLPAHARVALAPVRFDAGSSAEGSERVDARIAALRKVLIARLNPHDAGRSAEKITIDAIEELRGKLAAGRIGELRGILAELRVLESLRGELIDAHRTVVVPYLGKVGEIDAESADRFIEVSSGNLRSKTRQLKLLAKYAAHHGKKGLIVYVDTTKAGTQALGRFVEIGLEAGGSIEFRPIPWRR